MNQILECFALHVADGEFPPGPWAVAGRLDRKSGDREYGIFLGGSGGMQTFVPESRIGEVIADLKRQGEFDLATGIEGARGDIRALRDEDETSS
jgi:hypothetical protein